MNRAKWAAEHSQRRWCSRGGTRTGQAARWAAVAQASHGDLRAIRERDRCPGRRAARGLRAAHTPRRPRSSSRLTRCRCSRKRWTQSTRSRSPRHCERASSGSFVPRRRSWATAGQPLDLHRNRGQHASEVTEDRQNARHQVHRLTDRVRHDRPPQCRRRFSSMIVPDDKDWTWVLDRPCPECGFDAGTCPAATVAALRANAQVWKDLLANRQIRPGRPHDATWSSLEYAGHVRESSTGTTSASGSCKSSRVPLEVGEQERDRPRRQLRHSTPS